MSIIKPQLIICPYFGWLMTLRCVCDVTITPMIASTAENNFPEGIVLTRLESL